MKEDYIIAVSQRNFPVVRMSLSNELLLDPRGGSFNEMLQFAIEKLPGLFEENKEASYAVPPTDEWNEDFMFEVKSDLDSNFSKEKLAFYEAVVKYVGKDKAIKVEEEENSRQSSREAPRNRTRKRTVRITKVSGGVTVGGIIVATVGISTGMTMLTVLGGAILVGGVLLIMNDNRK